MRVVLFIPFSVIHDGKNSIFLPFCLPVLSLLIVSQKNENFPGLNNLHLFDANRLTTSMIFKRWLALIYSWAVINSFSERCHNIDYSFIFFSNLRSRFVNLSFSDKTDWSPCTLCGCNRTVRPYRNSETMQELHREWAQQYLKMRKTDYFPHLYLDRIALALCGIQSFNDKELWNWKFKVDAF